MTSWNKQRVGFPAWVICYSDFSFSTLAILNKCIILTVVKNHQKCLKRSSMRAKRATFIILIPLVHLKNLNSKVLLSVKFFKDRIYETTLCNFYPL